MTHFDDRTSRGGEREPNQSSKREERTDYALELLALTLLHKDVEHPPFSSITNPSSDQRAAATLVLIQHHLADIGRGYDRSVSRSIQKRLVDEYEPEKLPIPARLSLDEVEVRERNRIRRDIASAQGDAEYSLPIHINTGLDKLCEKVRGATHETSPDQGVDLGRTAELFRLLAGNPRLPFSFDAALGALQLMEHRPGLMALVQGYGSTD